MEENNNVQDLQTKRDWLLAHLLRRACASEGELADSLSVITSELLNLGIISEDVRNMAIQPSPSNFAEEFGRVFEEQITSSEVPAFWETTSDSERQSYEVLNPNYFNEFEDIKFLGQGGSGKVVSCRNKVDKMKYAVKKIKLWDTTLSANDDRILREVATHSRLQHQHVVQYYKAWYGEEDIGSTSDDSTTGTSSGSISYGVNDSSEQSAYENQLESTYNLYIQMEYCPRTLKQILNPDEYRLDEGIAWNWFRQIVEGLAYIHGEGITHRDLTPSNIFLDAKNNIKIGDFGLAKFLTSKKIGQDLNATEIVGPSKADNYFSYTAPEIEQGQPNINEKADIYSLGIVFFELWHPFKTYHERKVVLSELKRTGLPPLSWASDFPKKATLLQYLIRRSPLGRSSAEEILQHLPNFEHEGGEDPFYMYDRYY